MKKFISMLALGSMLVGLNACSSDDSIIDGDNEKGHVYIKLENVVSPGSRMTEDPKTDKDVTELRNGFIVFGTSKSAIRRHYEIVSDPALVDDPDHVVLIQDLREGKTFEGIPGDVTNVAIIGNVTEDELNPDDFHNNTLRNFNEVLAKKIQIRNQYADNMSHVALYDMQQLQGTSDKNVLSATLELKPMCARLEIPKIMPGPDIIEYKVDGIYLAGFYKESRIEQTLDRNDWVAPDYEKDPNTALDEFYKGYPYMENLDIKAVQETVTTGEGDAAATKEVTAYYPIEEGKVWAYPFFGLYEKRSNQEHYGLRLIVKVSGLKVRMYDSQGHPYEYDVKEKDLAEGIAADKAGIRYLNINGFVEEYHNTQAEQIKFYNGNVYQVQNFEITTQNLSNKIMPTDINVTLTVSVKPWVIKKVYPQI